jgi:uncharacterized membrane protein (GlpM family)
MWYYIIKVLSSSVIIVLITEISKKNSFWGSVLASIPLISLLAFLWIYIDTKDIKKISELSTGIFWLVIPSLAFFISFPYLLKKSLNFYLALIISLLIMVILYFVMVYVLKKFGIKI